MRSSRSSLASASGSAIVEVVPGLGERVRHRRGRPEDRGVGAVDRVVGGDVRAEGELPVAEARQGPGLGARYLAGEPVLQHPFRRRGQRVDRFAQQVQHLRRRRPRDIRDRGGTTHARPLRVGVDDRGRVLGTAWKPRLELGQPLGEWGVGPVGLGDAALALFRRDFQPRGDLRQRHTYR